jgi:two-component sensor histidine kinase
MNPPVRQSNTHVAWPSQVAPGMDVKPNYVCALVFVVVRVAGIIGASLSVPSGTRSLVRTEPAIAIVFVTLIALYLGAAAGLARGYFASFVRHRWVVAVDFALVAAVNLWASNIAPERQLDLGGNDLFWMTAIGSIALWGAVHGRVIAVLMMSGGAALLIAMSLANGFSLSNLNWSFVLSRLVFAGIGVITTSAGLRISERFEEFRRIQGQRAGEQQALGAMHRRALQDLKVISRLSGEAGFESGSSDDRLYEIHRHATALSEYVRTWPEQHQEPLDIDEAIRTAVAEADPLGSTVVQTDQIVQQSDVEIPAVVLVAVQEAVGEAVTNALQHGSPDGPVESAIEATRVTATIDQQRLFIDISDSGRGFDSEVEAIEVDDGSERESPSSGLGLTRIVDAMQSVGGTAILTTAPGEGATWTLSVNVDGTDVGRGAEGDDRLAS